MGRRALHFFHALERLRAIVLCILSVIALIIAFGMFFHVHGQTFPPVEIAYEHRFSVLETKIDSIEHEIKEASQYKGIQFLALAGLLGEAGLRVVRTRKKPEA